MFNNITCYLSRCLKVILFNVTNAATLNATFAFFWFRRLLSFPSLIFYLLYYISISVLYLIFAWNFIVPRVQLRHLASALSDFFPSAIKRNNFLISVSKSTEFADTIRCSLDANLQKYTNSDRIRTVCDFHRSIILAMLRYCLQFSQVAGTLSECSARGHVG